MGVKSARLRWASDRRATEGTAAAEMPGADEALAAEEAKDTTLPARAARLASAHALMAPRRTPHKPDDATAAAYADASVAVSQTSPRAIGRPSHAGGICTSGPRQ